MRTIQRKPLLASLRPTMTLIAAAILVAALPTNAYAKQVRLFIDPGHGGKDPGAMARGVAEKDVTLQISRYVAKAAKRQGWKVKMSRNSDTFVPINTRAKRANRWKATVFVSVHNNSMGKKPRGNMVIYRGKAGRKLSKRVMAQLDGVTNYRDIGSRRDVRGLGVLRGSRAPAVLVEALSVSAPKERKMLTNPKKQQAVAEAIVKGVARHQGVKYIAPTQPKPKAKKEAAPSKVETEKPVTSTKKAAAPAPKPSADKKVAAKRPEPRVQAERTEQRPERLIERSGVPRQRPLERERAEQPKREERPARRNLLVSLLSVFAR